MSSGLPMSMLKSIIHWEIASVDHVNIWDERVNHMSQCSNLVQNKYGSEHDWLGKSNPLEIVTSEV